MFSSLFLATARFGGRAGAEDGRKKIKGDSGVVSVHVTDKVPLIKNNESWQGGNDGCVNDERTGALR